MKIRAIAGAVADALVHGDNASDPRCFDGLQKCVHADRVFDAGNKPIDLAQLDAVIDSVKGTHKQLWMAKGMIRQILTIAPEETLSVGADACGHSVKCYRGLPMQWDVNREGMPVIGFNETDNTTSIYCVALGADGVHLVQDGEMAATDEGELPDTPIVRTTVEWFFTLGVARDNAVARLCNIAAK